MKSYKWIVLGSMACLLVAGGAYVWATSLMDSVYAYRSPLRAAPPAAGEPVGQPLTRRVMFVLIDALREDTSRRPEVMPFLNELRTQGAWAVMHSRPPSYSQPGYTALFTGAWPDLGDGPDVNLDYALIPAWTQDNLLSAARRDELKSAVAAYYWYERLIPPDVVAASAYTSREDNVSDRAAAAQVVAWLKDDTYPLVFMHFNQVDWAGHYEGGPRDPRWDTAARRVDDLLRELAGALDLSRDTLVVCSDHGQLDQGGHGGTEPITMIEPFVLIGAGVQPGAYGDIEMVDVAPTLAVLLGTNLPASAQGQARTEMLKLVPEQTARVQELQSAQQRQLVEAYQTAIGQHVAVQGDGKTVAAYQQALDAARGQRLNAERLPRGVVAVVIVGLLAAVLVRWRGRTLALLLGAALVYVVLFNVRYALIDGRTYSLSSIADAADIILYCAVTGLLALAISWFCVALGLGVFRQGARRAGELVLGLTFAINGLLCLPVLWSFVFNGALVTWTLPDFASVFMAFISLIQILLVSAFGLVLAGVTALIAVRRSRKEMQHAG